MQIKRVDAMSLRGRSVTRVDNRDVIVSGSVLIFGNSIQIMEDTDATGASQIIRDFLVDRLPACWSVETGPGHRLRLRFFGSGVVAITEGRIISGSATPNVNVVQIAASRSINLTSGTGNTPQTGTFAFQGVPLHAIPGSLLATGIKPHNAAAASGLSILAGPWAAQPIYAEVAIQTPFAPAIGDATSAPRTPMYFVFGGVNAISNPSVAQDIKAGDLTSFLIGDASTTVFSFASADPVLYAGLWLPSIETASVQGVTNSFVGVVMKIYGLDQVVQMPASGLAPPGTAPGQTGGLTGTPASAGIGGGAGGVNLIAQM